MRKIQFISFFILLFSAVTLTSCDDEVIDNAIDLGGGIDDPDNPTNTGPAYFRANFSGGTWNADNTTVVLSPTTFELVATRGTAQEGFGFSLDGGTVGTYLANENLVAFTPANSTYGYWGINPDNVNENTGSVTITHINTATQTVSGIFSYKGYWSDATVTNILPIVFTNGVFNNLPYTTQAPPSTDTFSTKINGTDFIDTAINVATVSNVITIKASNATSQSVTIGVRDNVTAGTYPITGNIGSDVVQASYRPNGVSLQAYAGSVTIISKTATRIKGTFNFTTSDGPSIYQFTVGQFDVEY